jgi:hypothetical protein
MLCSCEVVNDSIHGLRRIFWLERFNGGVRPPWDPTTFYDRLGSPSHRENGSNTFERSWG